MWVWVPLGGGKNENALSLGLQTRHRSYRAKRLTNLRNSVAKPFWDLLTGAFACASLSIDSEKIRLKSPPTRSGAGGSFKVLFRTLFRNLIWEEFGA
ncbi:hypothetical protein GDO81_018472 [Engystomops pustulosus]|uniref:Uncharacterized protein n=1 Tax=Engystomops pustulosus TaxID=76066 RepID=A0AAV6ZP12_ENGPU|nr:hypothetical protein GDO81_018472 [Engystomops pustulosus]